MAITLSKGGNISLSKSDPTLKKIQIGLGWDARSTDGDDFDLDASVFLLGADRKVPDERSFIFYNQLESVDGSVIHTGDNKIGAGEGDDEVIQVTLDRVAATIQVLAVTVTIHEAEARRQNFGQVHNAFIRLVNAESGQEIARYDLTEDYSTETAMIFGEIYRHQSDWKFRAVGQGYTGGLRAMCAQYGISVA